MEINKSFRKKERERERSEDGNKFLNRMVHPRPGFCYIFLGIFEKTNFDMVVNIFFSDLK